MQNVSNGIDNLARDVDALEFLQARRCGLVTNHTGIAADGRTTLEVMESLGVRVDVLFSPEHGFKGTREGTIESTVEFDRTVFSLYGETRRPTQEMLANLDALIFDIADVGARFYTYGSTLALCLEECSARGVAVVVLDRPNPLGGVRIEGPLVDVDLRSFVGHVRLPVIHGMTLGEIARLHSADEKLEKVRVVRCAGWNRAMTWPHFGHDWIAPSPNLPNFQSAAWYPGACLLEFCDVSVGRGTDAPFQFVGAPWIDAAKWEAAMDLCADELGAFRLETCEFIPQRATYEGQTCFGLRLSGEEIPENIVAPGMALLASLHLSHPAQFGIGEMAKSLSLLGSRAALAHLQSGDLRAAIELAQSDAQNFELRRREWLLY